MKCAHCPVRERPCLGERTLRLCELAETRADYRRLLVERASHDVGTGGRSPTLDELLGMVATCRHRGGVLPHRLQAECGCGELTRCHAGRGTIPGRVTMRDCLACVAARSSVEARCDDPPPDDGWARR